MLQWDAKSWLSNLFSGASLPSVQAPLGTRAVAFQIAHLELPSAWAGPTALADWLAGWLAAGWLKCFDCDKFMIVGESKNRNFASIKSPILNNCLDTRLNFVDKKTKAYKSIQLPPNISEIHAIMELNNV